MRTNQVGWVGFGAGQVRLGEHLVGGGAGQVRAGAGQVRLGEHLAGGGAGQVRSGAGQLNFRGVHPHGHVKTVMVMCTLMVLNIIIRKAVSMSSAPLSHCPACPRCPPPLHYVHGDDLVLVVVEDAAHQVASS